MTLAKAFKPDSPWSGGRALCPGALLPLFPANPLAKAGNAKLWVKVSLCKDSDREYGPTLPLAAALNKAYSRSRASNREYLAVIVDDRLLSFGCQVLLCLVGAATEVKDDVVEDEGDMSRTSSAEVWAGWRRRRAWSGWRRPLDGRRPPGLPAPVPQTLAGPPGDGDAWNVMVYASVCCSYSRSICSRIQVIINLLWIKCVDWCFNNSCSNWGIHLMFIIY